MNLVNWHRNFRNSFSTRLSSTRGTPLGLLGKSGSITRHSKSVSSYRLMSSLNHKSKLVGIPFMSSRPSVPLKLLATIFFLSLPVACLGRHDQPDRGQINLSSKETWLFPGEAKRGRALTLAGPTGIYIRTDKRCILPFVNSNGPPLPSDQIELAAMLQPVEVGGRRVDPLSNLIGILASGLRERYTIPSKENFWRLVVGQSFTCRVEQGEQIPTSSRDSLPDRIHVNFHSSASFQRLENANNLSAKSKLFFLNRRGIKYCLISLNLKGAKIESARIDAVLSSREIPKYSDYLAMDCFMRGVFASLGFTGILRFEPTEIYNTEDLNGERLSKGMYTATLLESFEKMMAGGPTQGDVR